MADNLLPEFNDLVRECYDAQEEFDNYDSRTGDDASQREMGRLSRAWSAANVKLIRYVLAYGPQLLTMEREDV
jgi:hypothetical protein